MNEKTIEYHLYHMAKNNRYEAHKKELNVEVSSLRLLSIQFKGSGIETESNLKANLIEKRMREASLRRIQI